jgi:hypothetical protein
MKIYGIPKLRSISTGFPIYALYALTTQDLSSLSERGYKRSVPEDRKSSKLHGVYLKNVPVMGLCSNSLLILIQSFVAAYWV